MYAKETCPNNSVGSDQDEAEIHYNRLSSQEWCNCRKSEKMPPSLEGMCCHKIPAGKAFQLKFKARLSWNTSVLEFFAVEFNCVGNHFFEGVFVRNFLDVIF